MIDLNDPDMKEIVDDFVAESRELLSQLNEILEDIEDHPEKGDRLEEFGQVIDRMMGAAQTMGAEEIGQLCQMGKIIGYKAGQNNQVPLTEMTCGVMFDLLDLLEEMFDALQDQSKPSPETTAFIGRLEWLSGKFAHIKRASCSFDGEDDGDDMFEEDTKTTAELQKLIGGMKG